MIESQNDNRKLGMEKFFFRASAIDFGKIPGNVIAYWLSERLINSFVINPSLSDVATTRLGMTTANNALFTRCWFEVPRSNFLPDARSQEEFSASNRTWLPYNKGGDYKKWYGNNDFVLYWKDEGSAIKNYGADSGHIRSTVPNTDYYFLETVTWSKISSGKAAFRYRPAGSIFDVAGACVFPLQVELPLLAGFLNSAIPPVLLNALSPTINFEGGQMSKLPVCVNFEAAQDVAKNARGCIGIAKSNWDDSEVSWDFTKLPLLNLENRQHTLKASYQRLRTHWREMTLEMQRLEEENNRIFIDAYGLQNELTPEVPLAEITLTCNPHYRYGGDKTEEEQEALLLADTMRELVSYAVGCMFGRYSLDKPGLILANQGETLADYLAQVPQPCFPADDDNVIPMLDGDWFADDITLRVRQFLRVAFGDAHYEDNLAFIEQALNIKGKRNYGLREYLLSEFYTDHVKRYKKRPIYWLFSSPKGSFNTLIYMHRYRPDTVSVVLRYLRDYREKLATERERQAAISINPASSQGDKTRALKETERLGKVLAELEDYERDVLYPLATQQVQIDLDDGVKVNYLKFGAALKKIPGLAAKDED
ncbi:BREX-1 system adenine-specific DNA-methyltransferase PglX [Pigmentiphaga sp. D-2]|uniref:BREX-1 system adenine-specific DNA-methyltransferase PglX n=1 Tax=Pigmentiphaga sp. D-2 TaxID=1002116 RepID=UPI0010518D60|nr:BREX-1 system adenine-specific DNA-methyltransferase PglX [Pigmentiphaga sp. D-2]